MRQIRKHKDQVTESKFELTEQHYRYLFENASDAMWVQNMSGKIIDANRACEKLTGFTRQHLIGKNVKGFLTPEFLSVAREIHRKLLNGTEISQPYEQRLVIKGGAIKTLMMATSLVTINGELRGFQHVARDITEEKRAEEMLSKITNGSPIPLFVINQQHKVTYWNTAAESLSGIDNEEIIGTDEQWRAFYNKKRPTMADLIVDGASADEIAAHYQGKSGKSRLIDDAYEAEDFFPALGENGKWLHFTASPYKSLDGGIIGAIETLQDITEEKQLQQNMSYYIQQVTRAQEDERKRVARELHDDAAPSILLLIQHLDSITSHARPRLSKSLRENLEKLRGQAIEALEQLRRCAQYLRPRILDDLGLIAALEWMAEDMEENYGIRTYVEVSDTERNLPAEAQVLLFRIAQEALSNIRKHAEASSATVKVEYNDDSTIMTVSDNGKGFKVPERLEELISAGSLGIMGMFERARLLRGTLDIKSESGKGTQIIIKLPS